MKIKRILLLLFILFFITGCHGFFMICSLNPFYLVSNITLEDEIEGIWKAEVYEAKEVPENNSHNTGFWDKQDTLYIWKIKRFANTTKYRTNAGLDSVGYNSHEKYYQVELVDVNADTAIYTFKLVLFTVNKVLYGDFIPEEKTVFANSFFASSNFFRVHTLARITAKNNELKLSFLGDDTMEQIIMERRVRVKFKWVEETKRLLLTASSADLTAMLERYGTEKRFIDWDSQSTMLNLYPFNSKKP